MSSTIKYFFSWLLFAAAACTTPYDPPAVRLNNGFLVVEGAINGAPNGITTITLSRSRSLTDSLAALPEANATVAIVAKSGLSYTLTQQSPGVYSSVPLNLNASDQYRISITGSGNRKYQSDFVPMMHTPDIDRLEWVRSVDGIKVLLSTRDPLNTTKYYRWEYVETWQYQAQLDPSPQLGVGPNNTLFYRDSTNQVHNCWQTHQGSDILLASTLNLSQSVINQDSITFIPQDSKKLYIRYSILLRQYGQTADAQQYWTNIQKNTQTIGSLFDPQPTQLVGNIHCLSFPDEPVIGYTSACNISEKRIFIANADVQPWLKKYDYYTCNLAYIPQDPNNFFKYLAQYTDTSYAPYYFQTPGTVVLAKRFCLDCTYQGGSPVKPSYW